MSLVVENKSDDFNKEIKHDFKYPLNIKSGLPRWLSGRESAYHCRRCRFYLRVGKLPGGGNGNPFLNEEPIFLPEKSHGQRILVGYSPEELGRLQSMGLQSQT